MQWKSPSSENSALLVSHIYLLTQQRIRGKLSPFLAFCIFVSISYFLSLKKPLIGMFDHCMLVCVQLGPQDRLGHSSWRWWDSEQRYRCVFPEGSNNFLFPNSPVLCPVSSRPAAHRVPSVTTLHLDLSYGLHSIKWSEGQMCTSSL